MDKLAMFRESLRLEYEALGAFLARVDGDTVEAIDVLYGCRGKVVVTGMGKCGHIARKLMATLISTGTPATFLHPAEAIHGDLGMVMQEDIVLALSNSGETDEVTQLLPHLRPLCAGIVALTSAPTSTLGKYAQVVIDTSVAREADPLDTAPTASTTLMLAVGDALAATLMQLRSFAKTDYAVFHPGGSLGRKLLCRVEELMHVAQTIPVVKHDAPIREALLEITIKRLGCTFVVNDAGVLAGVLTDGDVRRLLQREDTSLDKSVSLVMTCRPRHVDKDDLAVDVLRLMEENLITAAPVLDEDGRPIGAIHLHDLVKAGIA